MTVFSNPASSSQAATAAYIAGLLHLLGDHDPVLILGHTPVAIQHFLDTVPVEIVAKPEAPGKWSIGEVVQHLADSELVGGFRLRMVLAQDRPQLAGYDQDLWAARLGYRNIDIRDALEQFVALRRVNARLWQHLTPDDLIRVGLHNERGEESLAHMRRLCAAHDLLHLQQLKRIRVALLP